MSIFQPKKKTVEPDAVPTNVEQAIPIQGVFEDGIFLVGRNLWSKTFTFTDINYAVASREDKEGMFLGYFEILNSLDSGATTKITINNRRIQKSKFEERNMLPLVGDSLDRYRRVQLCPGAKRQPFGRRCAGQVYDHYGGKENP